MQDAGFLENRSSKPIGLGIVIGAHVAILAMIALAPPELVPVIKYINTTVTSIKDDTPPPPPPPTLPASRPKAEATKPTVVDPIVRANIDLTPTIVVPSLPQPQLLPSQPIEQPKLAEPLLVPAGIDPRSEFQPDYPPSLARAGIEGIATVRVLIGVDGRVKRVEMVDATDPAFFEATRRQALGSWRFKPATRDGVATESWRTMTVRFKMQG